MIVNILNYFHNFFNGGSKFIQIRSNLPGAVLSTSFFCPFFRGGGVGGEGEQISLEKSNSITMMMMMMIAF